MTFVVYPAGEYVVGSPRDEFGRQKDGWYEGETYDSEPLRKVRITRPFAILDREIVGGENDAFGEPSKSSSQSPTPKHPVTRCNWYHAVRFCRSLGENNGIAEDEQPYPNPDSLDPSDIPRDPDPRTDGAPRNWPVRLDRTGFSTPNRGRMGNRVPRGNEDSLWFRRRYFHAGSIRLACEEQ